jgi:hypothetical protein
MSSHLFKFLALLMVPTLLACDNDPDGNGVAECTNGAVLFDGSCRDLHWFIDTFDMTAHTSIALVGEVEFDDSGDRATLFEQIQTERGVELAVTTVEAGLQPHRVSRRSMERWFADGGVYTLEMTVLYDNSRPQARTELVDYEERFFSYANGKGWQCDQFECAQVIASVVEMSDEERCEELVEESRARWGLACAALATFNPISEGACVGGAIALSESGPVGVLGGCAAAWSSTAGAIDALVCDDLVELLLDEEALRSGCLDGLAEPPPAEESPLGLGEEAISGGFDDHVDGENCAWQEHILTSTTYETDTEHCVITGVQTQHCQGQVLDGDCVGYCTAGGFEEGATEVCTSEVEDEF